MLVAALLATATAYTELPMRTAQCTAAYTGLASPARTAHRIARAPARCPLACMLGADALTTLTAASCLAALVPVVPVVVWGRAMETACGAHAEAESALKQAKLHCYNGGKCDLAYAERRAAEAQLCAEEVASFRFGSKAVAKEVLDAAKHGRPIDYKAALANEPIVFSPALLRSVNGMLFVSTVAMLSLLPEHAAVASADGLAGFPPF